MVKNLPAMQEIWVQSLGWGDPLEKEMTTHSGILAWRIPWAEEPGRLQSMGSLLSHSIVFLYLFALIAEEGFLISSCYSLELCIQILISFLFSFVFCFSLHY